MKPYPFKSLLGLKSLETDILATFLNRADQIQNGPHATPIGHAIKGKTVLTLFFEPSTRTRVSFETAIKRLGGTSVSINLETSSVKKGETLVDTIKNLDAMGFDALIVRHKNGGVPHFIDRLVDVPVINAGDGFNEHPSQGLLDLYTMQSEIGDLKHKNVLILGDILHSRVARSNLWALTKMGASVFVAGPPTLLPIGIETMGATVIPDIDRAIEFMDVINVLRIQYERQDLGYFPSIREYRHYYGLTAARLSRCKPTLKILHPGPMNRGIEIDSDVADGPHNVILNQVKNGVVMRMAILDLLLNRGTTQ